MQNGVSGVMKFLFVILLIVFALYAFPFVAIELVTIFSDDPPLPEIRYGEFPFRLVYEINGEQIVIEDTIICEFDGIGRGGGSKWRRWTSRLASGDEEIILLRINSGKFIYYLPGSPEYYMGDLPDYATHRDLFPDAFISDTNRVSSSRWINADELYSEYGIRLISWEPSPAIVNSFR